MGLNKEQLKERETSLQRLTITTTQDDLGYVFISYKSDNWKRVFEDKVFALQERGLHLYCDKNFEDNNSSWLESMEDNVRFCSAFVMFLTREYVQSYATLIELLTAIKYRREIVLICEENRSDIFASLGQSRSLATQRITMEPGEGEALLELLRSDDNEIYKEVLSSVNNDLKTKIVNQRFTALNVVDAFRKILSRRVINENMFDKDLDALIRTIQDAASKTDVEEKYREVFGPTPQASPAPSAAAGLTPVPKAAPKAAPKAQPQLTPVPSVPVAEPKPLPKSDFTGTIREPRSMTLGEYDRTMEDPSFCLALREVRNNRALYPKGLFDYVHAALLRGCDQKIQPMSGRWHYCTYAISAKLDVDNPSMGASQFTWCSSCRKVVGLTGSNKLGPNSEALAALSPELTLGEVEALFMAQQRPEFQVKYPLESVRNVFDSVCGLLSQH